MLGRVNVLAALIRVNVLIAFGRVNHHVLATLFRVNALALLGRVKIFVPQPGKNFHRCPGQHAT